MTYSIFATESAQQTIRKTVMAIAIAVVGLYTAHAVHNVYDLHYKAQQRAQYNTMLLTFMRGGLPAVEARCILETNRPEEIAPCIKASTPVRGREL